MGINKTAYLKYPSFTLLETAYILCGKDIPDKCREQEAPADVNAVVLGWRKYLVFYEYAFIEIAMKKLMIDKNHPELEEIFAKKRPENGVGAGIMGEVEWRESLDSLYRVVDRPLAKAFLIHYHGACLSQELAIKDKYGCLDLVDFDLKVYASLKKKEQKIDAPTAPFNKATREEYFKEFRLGNYLRTSFNAELPGSIYEAQRDEDGYLEFVDLFLRHAEIPGNALKSIMKEFHHSGSFIGADSAEMYVYESSTETEPRSGRHLINNRRRENAKLVASAFWEANPQMTIEDVIRTNSISRACDNEAYGEQVIRGWIKDLCPNRKPGRRPQKK